MVASQIDITSHAEICEGQAIDDHVAKNTVDGYQPMADLFRMNPF